MLPRSATSSPRSSWTAPPPPSTPRRCAPAASPRAARTARTSCCDLRRRAESSSRIESPAMDDDLDLMTREELAAEVMKLRRGIRDHRDSTGHRPRWHHPALWAPLSEKSGPVPVVPEWPRFMQGCIRYRQSLDEQLPDAPRSHEPYRG